MENKINRKQVPVGEIQKAIDEFTTKLKHRLQEKGSGTLASRHEIQGAVDEEWAEALVAIRRHGPGALEEYKQELLDIAVGCVFGAACINAKTVDW